jgi:tetratricopeptide (TPR) repeat protein
MYFSRASNWTQHNLGRFRLSGSGAPETFDREEKRLAVAKLATNSRAKLGAAYLALDDPKRAVSLLTKATTANPELPAADWLVLAMAHAQLNETDQARKACAKAAALLKAAGADAALRPLLRDVFIALGPTSPEATALVAAAAGQPPAALNEAIDRNPNDAAAYRNRGNWYAEHGRFNHAIADFAELFRLEPSSYEGMQLGILLAYVGDKNRLHEHGQAMLSRWASSGTKEQTDHTLKTIILLPDFKADPKKIAHLAEDLVSGSDNEQFFEWFLFAEGLYNYRTGKYAESLAACRASRKRVGATVNSGLQILPTLDLVVEALALQGAGKADESRRTLDLAKPAIESHVPEVDGRPNEWHDWMSAHILYGEAESLLKVRKAEPKK